MGDAPAPRRYDRSEYRAWYQTPEWRRARKAQLMREPLCCYCLARGIVNDGSLTAGGLVQYDLRRRFLVADHIVPHRGDRALFFDGANLQTLCPDDHDRAKKREETRGYSNQRDDDGWPLDPQHPANR